MISNQELFKLELSSRAKMVFLYLKSRANKESKCFPSIKTIAAELSISGSTVKRALKDLEEQGLIERKNRHRIDGALSSNLYTLK